MIYTPDNKNIIDVSKSELGYNVAKLASETVLKLHDIVSDSSEIKNRSNSLTGYMLNDTMVFMQFIEILITAHKTATAKSYEQTQERYSDGV